MIIYRGLLFDSLLVEAREVEMETIYYIVHSIDGDYANLKRIDMESDDLKLVARALLPENINEGTKLKYEMLQYEVAE